MNGLIARYGQHYMISNKKKNALVDTQGERADETNLSASLSCNFQDLGRLQVALRDRSGTNQESLVSLKHKLLLAPKRDRRTLAPASRVTSLHQLHCRQRPCGYRGDEQCESLCRQSHHDLRSGSCQTCGLGRDQCYPSTKSQYCLSALPLVRWHSGALEPS